MRSSNVSTCPYRSVQFVLMSIPCAVRWMSSQRSELALPGNRSRWTRFENTSAPPPGIVERPASLKRANDSSGLTFHRRWK